MTTKKEAVLALLSFLFFQKGEKKKMASRTSKKLPLNYTFPLFFNRVSSFPHAVICS